jgi:hypothetical protein
VALSEPTTPPSTAARWAGRAALILGGVSFATGLGLLVLFQFRGPAAPLMLWGLLLLVVYAFFEPETVRALLGQGQLQAGSRAVLQVMLVIAAVVLLNMVVKDRLPDKQLDLSKGHTNTLAPQTVTVLKALPKPVKVTLWYLNNPSEVQAQKDLLTQYHNVSANLYTQVEGLQLRPQLAGQQHVAAAGTAVFEVDGRDPSTTTQSTEQAFTTILLGYVTTAKPKAYFLTGHGELDSTDSQGAFGVAAITQQLTTQGFQTATLNLRTTGAKTGPGGQPLVGTSPSPAGASPAATSSPEAASPAASPPPAEASPAASATPATSATPTSSATPGILASSLVVPKDADVLVLMSPNQALSTDEVNAIVAYVQGGGSVFVSVEPGSKSNVNTLLSQFGLSVGGGFIIDEQLIFRGAQQASNMLFDQYGSGIVSRGLSNTATVFLESAPIEGAATSGFQMTPYLTTTNNSCERIDIKDATFPCKSADKKGPFKVLVSLEQTNARAGTHPGRLVVSGDGLFAANALIQAQNPPPGNGPLFINAMNWLAQRDKVVNIPARNATPASVFLNEGQKAVVYPGLFLFLPVLVGVVGVVVYVRRRAR